jgi:mannosyltransferase
MRPSSGAGPAVLVVALLAGAALRVERLGRAELTTDEAFSWRMSTHRAREIVRRTAADVHPPLYYLVLRGWTGLFGVSPWALRGLSLFFGLASIPIAYAVARELDRELETGAVGAAAAAVLVALHADQVGHARAVRMYTMGMALAGASAWLLLRALRSDRRPAAWWTAYAIAAAALCYTHYYGAFTVGAQLLFAGVDAVRERTSAADGRRRLLAVVGGAVLVAALFAPWLAVLGRQASRVSGDYWIHDTDAYGLGASLVQWLSGLEWTPSWPRTFIAGAAIAAFWALWRGDRGQRFLALQATVPWLAALAVSAAAGRTLFLERYLVFAQLAMLVGVGRAWAGLGPLWTRHAVALGLGAAIGLGLAAEVGARPAAASSAEEGARELARSVAPGDLVLANAPRDLNVLRYYLDREGAAAIAVRCPASRSIGHLSQVSSIDPEDILDDGAVWSGTWARVWRVRLHPPRKWRPEPAPSGWRTVFTRVFEGPASTRLYVTADVREAPR